MTTSTTTKLFRVMAAMKDGSAYFVYGSRTVGAAAKFSVRGEGCLTRSKRHAPKVDIDEANRLSSHKNGLLADGTSRPNWEGVSYFYFAPVKPR